MDISFETERLLLRPHTADDVQAAYEINLDPEVSRFTHDGGVQPLEVVRDRIVNNVLGDYKKYGYGRMAVIHKPDNKFIGFCGLKYLEDFKEVDLGYRFARPYWGKGIATEACQAVLPYGFDELGLSRIIALALEDNVASIRVMQKLHFQFTKLIEEDGATAVWYTLESQDFQP